MVINHGVSVAFCCNAAALSGGNGAIVGVALGVDEYMRGIMTGHVELTW